MPINADFGYQKAEQEYLNADSTEKKIAALKKMMTLAPSHKSAESLQKQLKNRLAKLKGLKEKEEKQRKSSGGKNKFSIKKEGAATIAIVGVPNSGKSTLLNKLTNAGAKVADYEFTTTKPEVGIMNFSGIKLQVIEMPAIVKKFNETENGMALIGLIRTADLIVMIKKNPEDIRLIEGELRENEVGKRILVVERADELEDVKEMAWKALELIRVYTKQPGKKPDFPPVALKKGANVQGLAEYVHKDFTKKFKYARIWGSAKFPGQVVGLNYKLADEDKVELHSQ